MPKFVTVGNTTLDWIVTQDGKTHPNVCGGNAFYTAIGAHLWNNIVGVVTRVGMDFPKHILDDFKDAGIDVNGIKELDIPHSVISGIRYHHNGQRVFFIPNHEASEDLESQKGNKVLLDSKSTPMDIDIFNPTPEDVPANYWTAKGYSIASMLGSVQIAFAKSFSERSKLFTWDSPDSDGYEMDIKNWIGKATAFLPSYEEIQWLVDDCLPENAMKILAELGTDVVALKLGAEGSLVLDVKSRQKKHIQSYPTTVIDPTGAGDAYCGGFLAGYFETGDAIEAAMRATVSSSFIVEGFDARYALKFNRKDAEKRLKFLRSITFQ